MDLFKRIQDLSAIYDDDSPSAMVPESRPMFNERMQFDGGGTPLQRLRQEIVESMKPYAPGDVTEDQLQLVVKDITLDMTPEQAQASALSNFRKLFGMADGGRAGYEDGGMLVKPNDDGSRPGYRKPRGPKTIESFSPEIQKRIKDYGVKKYNALTNEQRYEVRNARTSTTPYNFNFGKKKFDATVTGLTKKGANNLQQLLNIINEKDLTPNKWFGKTSKAGGAKSGLDLLARDVVKYLKGDEVKGINKTIFDTIDLKNLIGEDKVNNLSTIDGKSFRQTKGTAGSAKAKVESTFDAVKLLNKEFMLDPDVGIEELAERLYGKGASNSVRAMKDTQADVLKYLDVLKTGTRAGVKIPDFKYPSADKAFEILDSIEDRSSTFGFQDGAVRELKFNIRDNLLNFKKGSSMSLRRMLSEVIADSDIAGSVIDEAVGLTASYDKLPGYTEATQILPTKLNQRKAAEIDKPFNEIINKVYDGTATPKEIKAYNASARKFMKETKIDVPLIRSTVTGDDIKNPSKYIRNLSSFSEEAQKNILDLAKNKNFVIQTGARPLSLQKGKATMETAREFLTPQLEKQIKIQFCTNRAGGPPGTCDISEAMDNMIKQTNAVKQGVVKGPEATRVANKAAKVARFGTGRALAKVLGPIGLAGEAVFEVAMAVPGYGKGKSGKRILGDSLLGLIPGVGQSAEEEFAEYATREGMSPLEQQKIKDVNRFLELNNALPLALKNIGKGGRGDPSKGAKTFEKQYKEYEPLYNQFVGGPPSESASTIFAEQQRINDLIKADEAARAEKRNIAMDEDFMAAGGGIAKMAGDRSGPPPQSGPNSQGLQGLFNRVKKV